MEGAVLLVASKDMRYKTTLVKPQLQVLVLHKTVRAEVQVRILTPWWCFCVNTI